MNKANAVIFNIYFCLGKFCIHKTYKISIYNIPLFYFKSNKYMIVNRLHEIMHLISSQLLGRFKVI